MKIYERGLPLCLKQINSLLILLLTYLLKATKLCHQKKNPILPTSHKLIQPFNKDFFNAGSELIFDLSVVRQKMAVPELSIDIFVYKLN